MAVQDDPDGRGGIRRRIFCELRVTLNISSENVLGLAVTFFFFPISPRRPNSRRKLPEQVKRANARQPSILRRQKDRRTFMVRSAFSRLFALRPAFIDRRLKTVNEKIAQYCK